MARKATWQRHADQRSAYVARYIYIIILLYIIEVFVLPYMGRVIRLVTVGSYKPDGFRHHFCVGLISTLLLPISGDVGRGGASDRDRSAPIEWTRGPRIKSRSRAFLKKL